jgi:hypothetical protein
MILDVVVLYFIIVQRNVNWIFYSWKIFQSLVLIEHFWCRYSMKDFALLIVLPSVWIFHHEYYFWECNEILWLFLEKHFMDEEKFVLATNLSRVATFGLWKSNIKSVKSFKYIIMNSWCKYNDLKWECPKFILAQLITIFFILSHVNKHVLFNIMFVLFFAIMMFNIRTIFVFRHHHHSRRMFLNHVNETWVPNNTEIVNLYQYSLSHDICQDILDNCKVIDTDSKQTSGLRLKTAKTKYYLLKKKLPKELCDVIFTFYPFETFAIKYQN